MRRENVFYEMKTTSTFQGKGKIKNLGRQSFQLSWKSERVQAVVDVQCTFY